MERVELLKQGLSTAFISSNTMSDFAYKPQFISNNYKEGKKVIASIESELLHCEEFCISVAFVTMGGITPLLQTLKELERRNIPGKILTTDYLQFSDPRALKKLSELKNLGIKMFITNQEKEGFHTKGYIFRIAEMYRIIVGSSNMTMSALTTNHEWNTRIVSTEQGEYAKDILNEFKELWDSPKAYAYDDIIDYYTDVYEEHKRVEKKKLDTVAFTPKYTLHPNSMQLQFIDNLKRICDAGEDRALLVSSTGTGKTYASAFAIRELKFKRILFVVHRGQIAQQAMQSFKRVFNDQFSMGLVSGNEHDYSAEFVFSTVQTLSKQESLDHYNATAFDAIIIDEAHHSSANSYKKIMDYFTPKMWIGMTATPDRRDDYMDGRNVYEIFNHQIALEIRLQDALEEDLLCPFHYFGITDLDISLTPGKTSEEKLENFRYLTCDERVDNIIEQANYFGYSGERVKGLIFCSRIDEAKALSDKLNEKGLRTVALSGSDRESVREEMVERLAGEECEDALDYILSVDIFSEGVDVPEINQIIMLRPTESPIVFVQQLGRGLRKAIGKEYVVILDFIGNYENNFMIPIALSGDRSYNKDNIRRYISEGGRVIPGSSTIHFDEISRKRIFQAIDNANFSDLKLIKENYNNLKNKLGHVPGLDDFDKYGEMDVLRIFDNNGLGSYHKFLTKYEPEYTRQLSKDEENVIEFISKKLASGKRIHELELLRCLLEQDDQVITRLKQSLKEHYNVSIDDTMIPNIINVMTNEFMTGTNKNTYSSCVFLTKDNDDYRISDAFKGMFKNEDFVYLVNELVMFGISRYCRDYSQPYKNTNFVLYKKYTYEDVCRLLNWEKNVVAQNIGGYKYDEQTKTFPVFINYDKSDDISDSINYEDHFISHDRLIAISKSKRTLSSPDVDNFLYSQERGIKVPLFVRKNKDDKISKEFYYLGNMISAGAEKASEFLMPNTSNKAVEMEWILETPVRDDLYEYIVNG